MKKLVISRCLLGAACRYDGRSKPNQTIIDFVSNLQEGIDYITICPETAGGLSIPRAPGEITAKSTADVLSGSGKVESQDGKDYTPAFINGAQECCQNVLDFGAETAILKAKSPSCGVGQVYDGTFTRSLRNDDGVAAAMLKQAGLKLFTEKDWHKFLEFYNNSKNDGI